SDLVIRLASGSGKLCGLRRPEAVAALPQAGPPGSGPLVTPFVGVPPGEPSNVRAMAGTGLWSAPYPLVVDLAGEAEESLGRDHERRGVGCRPLCASSPVVVSGRSRCSARWMDPSYPVTGAGCWSGGARVRRRHLRCISLYSECCRSSVPGNLTALMAYHVIVPFHHAHRPCGRSYDRWRPPYLHPTSFPRRVDHISGSVVRGREDVTKTRTTATTQRKEG
ncbi:hypothetical protein GW17_00047463, partial [Ensete ventricosum]